MSAIAPVTGTSVDTAEPTRPPGGDFAALLALAADDAEGRETDAAPALPDLGGSGPGTVTLGEMVQSLAGQDSQFVSDLPPAGGGAPGTGGDNGPGEDSEDSDGADAVTASNGSQASSDRPAGISAQAWEHPAVRAASEYLGVPYKWGGTNPDVGLDCSGLVQRAFRDVGVELPRVSADQSRAGNAVPGGLDDAQPGDLIYYAGSSTNHIGIYLGDGEMLHAPRRGEDVQVGSVRQADPTRVRRVM